MTLVFRVLKKSGQSTGDVHEPAAQANITDDEALAQFAQSCLDGHPDGSLYGRYQNSSLGGTFDAIYANPKIAQVYAP